MSSEIKPDMQRIFRNSVIIAIIIFILMWLFNGYLYYKDTRQKRIMDEVEKQFDANDYFLLIEQDSGLVGLYDGNDNIVYFKMSSEDVPSSGVYNIPVLVYRWVGETDASKLS